MKFNMGCGARKLPGFINVDAVAACSPDEVYDLESTPWPWPSDVADEIHFIHSLEHMGADPKVFLALISELYRVAKDRCAVMIHVPHPRHDDFLSDPTHVRPILRETLLLFDQVACRHGIASGAANTPLGVYLGVDFELIHTDTVLAPAYFAKLKSGEASEEEIQALLKTHLNIAKELRFQLVVHKPIRSAG